MAHKRSTLMMGASLLALAAGSGLVVPDCSKLYSRQWSGGTAKAEQGSQEYTWVFNPCTPAPVPKCNQPPYSGDIYLAQLNTLNPNPCVHELFCPGSPNSTLQNSSGVVTYNFLQCTPSQTGTGPSPRSATVHVVCDSPAFRVDPVIAVQTHPGYHFTVTVHGPCGAPPPPPTPPLPPMPGCPSQLASLPPLYFTQPLHKESGGDVYEWAVNLCNSTLPPSTPLLWAEDTVTKIETILDERVAVVSAPGGWVFHLASSTSKNTGKITVEQASGEPCRFLSPPIGGVNATANRDFGVVLSMTLKCL